VFAHPVTGVPLAIAAGALSKLLRNHAFVEAMEQGIKIPIGKGAASTIAATRLLKLAGDAAKPLAQYRQAAANRQPKEQPVEVAAAQ